MIRITYMEERQPILTGSAVFVSARSERISATRDAGSVSQITIGLLSPPPAALEPERSLLVSAHRGEWANARFVGAERHDNAAVWLWRFEHISKRSRLSDDEA